jgi:hypothetical protein
VKLWRIYQDVNSGYDTYDSAIVVAPDEDAARLVNPDGKWGRNFSAWAPSPDNVGVVCIGQASPELEAGAVVLASFNAG